MPAILTRGPFGPPDLVLEACARAAHEANRAYCATVGDEVAPPWPDAPDWQRKSSCDGVWAVLMGLVPTPQVGHARWLEQKLADGWTYGSVRNADKKQHPCVLPYDQLPPVQRAKDELFIAVVVAMSRAIGEATGTGA